MKSQLKYALPLAICLACLYLLIQIMQLYRQDHSSLIFNHLHEAFLQTDAIVQPMQKSKQQAFLRFARVYMNDFNKKGLATSKATLQDVRFVDSLFALAEQSPSNAILHATIDSAINTTIDSMKARMEHHFDRSYAPQTLFLSGSHLCQTIASQRGVAASLTVQQYRAAFQAFQLQHLQNYWNQFRGGCGMAFDSHWPVCMFDQGCFTPGQPLTYAVALSAYSYTTNPIITVNSEQHRVKEGKAHLEVLHTTAGDYPYNIQIDYYNEENDSLLLRLQRTYMLHVSK